MSDYIEQNKLQISFNKDDSWIILSPIEQSIKTQNRIGWHTVKRLEY